MLEQVVEDFEEAGRCDQIKNTKIRYCFIEQSFLVNNFESETKILNFVLKVMIFLILAVQI